MRAVWGGVEVNSASLVARQLHAAQNGSEVEGDLQVALNQWVVSDSSRLTAHLNVRKAPIDQLLSGSRFSIPVKGGSFSGPVTIEGTPADPNVTATLNLAGQDFQSQRERGRYLRGAERLIVPGATNLLLQHNPDVFPVAARQGYNLLLAGHTHGGQVTVEILDQSINPARFFTPYVYGLYRIGASAAYVTRGIGTIGIPARIGAPPEITLLRLRKA